MIIFPIYGKTNIRRFEYTVKRMYLGRVPDPLREVRRELLMGDSKLVTCRFPQVLFLRPEDCPPCRNNRPIPNATKHNPTPQPPPAAHKSPSSIRSRPEASGRTSA